VGKIREFFIKKIFKAFGLPGDIYYFIRAFLSIGYPSHAPFPRVLLVFNLRNFVRGLFTRFIVSSNLDWIWPFWINRQFYPRSSDFTARGFQPVSTNATHRNWTGIGTLNSSAESTVDPRGLVTPFINGWSLDNWLIYDNKVYSPSNLPKVNQKLYKNLPKIITEFQVENFKISSFVFVGANELDVIYQKVTIKNMSKSVKECAFAFAIRPYNNEGLSLVHDIDFPDNSTFFVNNKVGGAFIQPPDELHSSHLSKGDVALFIDETTYAKEFVSAHSRVGLATAIAKYNLVLNAGQSKTFEIRMPMKKIHRKEALKKDYFEKLTRHNFDKILTKSTALWEDNLCKGTQVTVPDKKIMSAFQANKAYLLLFYDGDEITPGPSTYHHFWFRDAAYMVHALDLMGYHEEAGEILKTYPKRQRKSGEFHSQAGEWDSCGQAIWTMVEHYKLTKDYKYLKKIYPSLRNAAHWLIRKRWQNKKKKPGYRGLLPAGLSAEHFGLSDYYYWDDFWGLAGLRDTLFAAKTLHKSTFWWQKNYLKFFDSVNKSLKYIEGNFGRPIIPISPSRRMDSAAVGSIVSYYPLKLLPPEDIRLVNTVKHLRENNFIGDGFFHDINHAGYGTYLSIHVAQCLLGQRDADAYKILKWFLQVASKTWCWPESIHPRTMGGTVGDGHHGWALVEMLIFVRNMLFFEENDRLVITPILPLEWLKKDNKIAIANAPSEFGEVNFEILVKGPKRLALQLNTIFTDTPKTIEWNLPGNIKSVKIDGKEAGFSENKVLFSAQNNKIEVVLL
jgi:hypothetical protein